MKKALGSPPPVAAPAPCLGEISRHKQMQQGSTLDRETGGGVEIRSQVFSLQNEVRTGTPSFILTMAVELECVGRYFG